MMVCAWKANNRTTVEIKPMMDTGLIPATNDVIASDDFFCKILRVIMPAIKGKTTYKTVDKTKVFQGTVTLVTPNKNAAIGAKATTMIKSLTDTCTKV